MDWKRAVEEAHKRINCHVNYTPLLESTCLSQLAPGSKVFVKLESEQVTGSFKIRGAFNKLLQLQEKDAQCNPITASTGNHALAFNYATKKLGMRGTVVVPRTVSATKDKVLQLEGAMPVYHGDDCVDAERYARKTAQDEGRIYISPYNDTDIVVGQGTIGMEILEQLQDVDAVLVPVGGGGLIGGIAAYIKSVKPGVKIYGCQPSMSDVMYTSVKAGHIVDKESFPTLSDGTAGGIEEDAVTFDLCCKFIDDWILVNEDEISLALYTFLDYHHKVVEGAAGVSIGGFMKNASLFKDKKVVIVACGSNISTDNLLSIINKHKK